jgi:hypothetical protein
MHSKTTLSIAMLALASALSLVGCGGGGSAAATDSNGTVAFSMTDAPACGYDHVNVTVEKVRINQSATASETDAGWVDVTLNPAKRVDLLTLSNGVLTSLGQTSLSAGHYAQLQLVLAANDSANPLANSVVPTGGQEVALTTPSAQQTGLKLNVDIDVTANQLADFVLDFNACKSVVKAGASGKFLLKPVIAVTPHYASGVSGYVEASVANANTVVSLQQGGKVVKATTPDASGHFLLEPVAPGSYDLVITAAGHATEVVTGVTVSADAVTTLNAQTTPLSVATSTSGGVVGVVTSTVTPIDATIDATQGLANGDTIEVAETHADATTGAYVLSLPATAPLVAAYSASATSYSFAADSHAGSSVSLVAASGSTLKTAGPLTVNAGVNATVNFSF